MKLRERNVAIKCENRAGKSCETNTLTACEDKKERIGTTGTAKTREENIRKRTALLSFVLTVLVIFVHAVNYDKFIEGVPVFLEKMMHVQIFLSEVIGQLGAPCFFLVSGFLFYRNFDFTKLFKKWNSRVHSLLIPYLLWNLLYFLAATLIPRIPVVARILGRTAAPVTVKSVAEGIVLFGNNPVFWFIFQLILLTALAPIIGLVTKSRIAALVALLGLLVSFKYQIVIPYFNTDALFYYLIGSMIGAEEKRWKDRQEAGSASGIQKRRILRFITPVIFLMLSVFLYRNFEAWPSMLNTILYRAAGILFVATLVTAIPAVPTREFMKYNFFLYALHFPLLRGLNKVLAAVTKNAAVGMILYFVLPVICVAMIIVIAKLMKKLFPGLYKVLAGGR